MPANQQQVQYFSQNTPELSIDTTPYALGALGQEVLINVGGSAATPNWRTYKYVKAGGTIGARSLLTWNGVSKIGYEVITSVDAAATNVGLFAGVSAADSSVTSGQYFWIVVPYRGTTAQIAHNVASNATQSDTGLFWVVSSGSLGSRVTTFASNTSITDVRLLAMNISAIVSSSVSTSVNSSGHFIFL